MLFKQLKCNLNDRTVSIDFKEGSCQIINSSYILEIMHILETLIIGDSVGYLQDYDRSLGCYYSNNDESELIFSNNSSVRIFNRKVFFNGEIPKIHCVRHISNAKIRSSLLNGSIIEEPTNVDMTKYSNAITDQQWLRCISLMNQLIGSDIVDLSSNRTLLRNSFYRGMARDDINLDVQKFIYTIVAECFLTPDGYKRLVLLPRLEFLGTRLALDLIKTLGKISKHELLISDLKVTTKDIREDDNIIIVNI